MKCVNCDINMHEGRMFYQDDGIILADLAHEGFCSKKCIFETIMLMMEYKKLDYDNLYIPCTGFQCSGSMKADRKNKRWVCKLEYCDVIIPFEEND